MLKRVLYVRLHQDLLHWINAHLFVVCLILGSGYFTILHYYIAK